MHLSGTAKSATLAIQLSETEKCYMSNEVTRNSKAYCMRNEVIRNSKECYISNEVIRNNKECYMSNEVIRKNKECYISNEVIRNRKAYCKMCYMDEVSGQQNVLYGQ